MLRSLYVERGKPNDGSDLDQASGPKVPGAQLLDPQLDPVINIITRLELPMSRGGEGALDHLGSCFFLKQVMRCAVDECLRG